MGSFSVLGAARPFNSSRLRGADLPPPASLPETVNLLLHLAAPLILFLFLKVVLLALINEYTDWSVPSEHAINIFDSLLDVLGDALVVAPLNNFANLYHRMVRRGHEQSLAAMDAQANSAKHSTPSNPANIFSYVFVYQVNTERRLSSSENVDRSQFGRFGEHVEENDDEKRRAVCVCAALCVLPSFVISHNVCFSSISCDALAFVLVVFLLFARTAFCLFAVIRPVHTPRHHPFAQSSLFIVTSFASARLHHLYSVLFHPSRWQHEQSEKSTSRLGCVHGDELAYLFGAPLAAVHFDKRWGHFPPNFTRPEVTLSETVMAQWTNFVKFG